MAHQPTQFQIPFDQIRPGMVIIAGDGFGCLTRGDHCIVMQAIGGNDNDFYVHCRDGFHFLINEGGFLKNFVLPSD